MSAVIFAFPRPSPIRALCRPADCSAPFTSAWCAQHLPLIDAAMDLLEADDAKFGRQVIDGTVDPVAQTPKAIRKAKAPAAVQTKGGQRGGGSFHAGLHQGRSTSAIRGHVEGIFDDIVRW